MLDSAVGRKMVSVTARIVRRVLLWVRKLSIAIGMEIYVAARSIKRF